jgi:hypothetical protein
MAVLHFKKSSKLTHVIRNSLSPALFKISYIKELAFARDFVQDKNIQFEKVVTHEYKGLYNPMVTTFWSPRGAWLAGGVVGV